jgi:hypothetical protein
MLLHFQFGREAFALDVPATATVSDVVLLVSERLALARGSVRLAAGGQPLRDALPAASSPSAPIAVSVAGPAAARIADPFLYALTTHAGVVERLLAGAGAIAVVRERGGGERTIVARPEQIAALLRLHFGVDLRAFADGGGWARYAPEEMRRPHAAVLRVLPPPAQGALDRLWADALERLPAGERRAVRRIAAGAALADADALQVFAAARGHEGQIAAFLEIVRGA